MDAIKNLIYLDEYKMYSLASQLFGGVTESVVNYDATTAEKQDKQDGNFFSGRSMADILTSATLTQERKYLHDYAYTLFENELDQRDKLVRVTQDDYLSTVGAVCESKFLAVRGKIVFHDIEAVRNMLSKFNDIGEAIAYLMTPEAQSAVDDELPIQAAGASRRRGRSQGSRGRSRLDRAKESAKTSGLAMDPTYMRKLAEILGLAYEGYFYVTMNVGPYVFSAATPRQYFREPEQLILKKYSRVSRQDFVLVGAVAQPLDDGEVHAQTDAQPHQAATGSEPGDEPEPELASLRDGIENMTGIMHNLDEVFSGKQSNEVVVDPVALYREI